MRSWGKRHHFLGCPPVSSIYNEGWDPWSYYIKLFFKKTSCQVIQAVTFLCPSWRSPTTFKRVTFHHPQKGHNRRKGQVAVTNWRILQFLGFFPKHVFFNGCFLKWWYLQNTSKWSLLVGKSMVVGYHHFWKHPNRPSPGRSFHRNAIISGVFVQGPAIGHSPTLQGTITYPNKREKEYHRLKSALVEHMLVSGGAF